MPDGNRLGGLFGLTQRLPPSNTRAEQALLGAVLSNNKAIDRCEGLAPEHFADPINGRIFQEARKLIEVGRVADAVTLKSIFENAGTLTEVGGTAYLTELLSAMVGLVNVGDYAHAIRDTWLRRQVINIAAEAADYAFGVDTEVDGEGAISTIMEQLLSLGEQHKTAPSTEFGKAIDGALKRAQAAHKGEAGHGRLDTGIPSVDRLWAGLWPGQLYVVMARSNTGKTPFMLQIARHVAGQFQAEAAATGKPPRHVHIWSLEMTAEDLANVNLASVTRWTADQIKAGAIGGPKDWLEFQTAAQAIASLPIVIDDEPETDMPTLARRSRVMRRQKDTGLICVDFRELVRRGREQSRMPLQEWLPFLCYQLKGLAKACGVPLIALAQINKPEKGVTVGFPSLGDLPYGGEQACDGLFALHRPELYMSEEPPTFGKNVTSERLSDMKSSWEQERQKVAGLCEFGVVKRRFGPKGIAKLRFDGPRMLLSEWHIAPSRTDFSDGSHNVWRNYYGN